MGIYRRPPAIEEILTADWPQQSKKLHHFVGVAAEVNFWLFPNLDQIAGDVIMLALKPLDVNSSNGTTLKIIWVNVLHSNLQDK